jgi:hypothetical protein
MELHPSDGVEIFIYVRILDKMRKIGWLCMFVIQSINGRLNKIGISWNRLDGEGSTEKHCACGNEKNAFLTPHQRKQYFPHSSFSPFIPWQHHCRCCPQFEFQL